MPKKAEPWFRASSGTWVVSTKGKLTTLAKGKENHADAVLKWREIQSGPTAMESGPTIGEVVDRYMAWASSNLALNTIIWYRRNLDSFAAFVGRRRPSCGLKPVDCLDWLGSKTWGQSTKHGAITAIKRLFSWAISWGLVAENPFKALERPGATRRETIPTTAEVNEMLDAARDGTRDYLVFLAETGCRQSEVYGLTLEQVDMAVGVVVKSGKTTRVTGKPRVIYLTAVAMAIIRRRAAGLGRKDYIFVTRAGTPWTRASTKDAVKLIRKRLGLGPHVTAGALRHWWVTDRLRAGASIAMVAQLAGHQSTVMISKHYGHLEDHGEDLRRALERKAS